MKQPKVAIVHDWFVGGGAEKVVLELHKMFPDAPIYTSYISPEWRKRLGSSHIVTSYMQIWPLSRLRKFIAPLRALWFSRLDLSKYDLVISSSGAEAKGVKVPKPAIHVSYCHAPTHYYWSRYEQYLREPGFGVFDPLARLGLRLLVGPMRRWDRKAAQRPRYLIANSGYIKDQIKKYYGRDSIVIHPPVDIERFEKAPNQERNGFIVAGRQTPYKRIDLAVAAATKLNLPLVVTSDGPEHQKLLRMAGTSVRFDTNPTDEEMAGYFKSAEAFIFPGVDDFGIVAVEALAAGTPVIAYGEGGALDYIESGRTGLLFRPHTVDALTDVLRRFRSADFDHLYIAKRAREFGPERFRQQIKDYLNQIGAL